MFSFFFSIKPISGDPILLIPLCICYFPSSRLFRNMRYMKKVSRFSVIDLFLNGTAQDL